MSLMYTIESPGKLCHPNINNTSASDLDILLGKEDPRTEALRRYSYGIVLPAICCLGIIGNVLNLVVLTRKNMRGTAYIYMRASFIQKCKRHDENLNDCLTEQANNAVVQLFRGNENLRIPSITPLIFPRFLLEPANDFFFEMRNVQVSGLENMKIEKLDMNFKLEKLVITITVPKVIYDLEYNVTGPLEGDNYKHTGKGRFEFDKPFGKYIAEFEPTLIDGEYYLQMKNSAVTVKFDKIQYSLVENHDENKEEAKNLMNLLNDNSFKFREEFIPTVKVFSTNFLDSYINNILKTTPMCQLFD